MEEESQNGRGLIMPKLIPRFEIDIETEDPRAKFTPPGEERPKPVKRTLTVYAATKGHALVTARSAGYHPVGSREAGFWDEDACRIVGDSTPIVVEGDVYARSQKPAK